MRNIKKPRIRLKYKLIKGILNYISNIRKKPFGDSDVWFTHINMENKLDEAEEQLRSIKENHGSLKQNLDNNLHRRRRKQNLILSLPDFYELYPYISPGYYP